MVFQNMKVHLGIPQNCHIKQLFYSVFYPVVCNVLLPFSKLCESLFGQKVATVLAHQLGEFPKNILYNLWNDWMKNAVLFGFILSDGHCNAKNTVRRFNQPRHREQHERQRRLRACPKDGDTDEKVQPEERQIGGQNHW